ncbi:vacuolar sorting protein VPS33/slp1 [Ascosphaera aggregata]|nr:vacuolar sorting protein VPS33/slp1 [Ascosphaera aggregata]
MASLIDAQRKVLLDTIRNTGGRDWKVLILDDQSKSLVFNAVKEDDILNENVSNIEYIENRRATFKDTPALYILSPQPYLADCIIADLQRRRYRNLHIVWTSKPSLEMKNKITAAENGKELVAEFKNINIDFLPREGCLALFRDPWSFEILFNPSCGALVKRHLEDLAQKITSVCVALGEYPIVRYYRPNHLPHEARVLCPYLAKFVQQALDEYAKSTPSYPSPSNRPRSVLYILDRSIDLDSPLIHEFTYQAMVHDLLLLKEGEKVLYNTVLGENKERQDMEITEEDKVWRTYRHVHMKDVLGMLVEEFKKFRKENAAFDESSESAAKINVIKDMLAGLRDYQEGKNTYTLHLNMAQECMKIFQEHKLIDVASLEQILATKFDDDGKKPRQVAEELVRLLDDEAVSPPDRLRLIIIYVLYRNGLLEGDIKKLLAHSNLPQHNMAAVTNLDLLGARPVKPLKDQTPPIRPLFTQKPPRPSSSSGEAEDGNVNRYEPHLKMLLEEHVSGTLDPTYFPSTQPTPEGVDPAAALAGMSQTNSPAQTSLRSNKPTWARSRGPSTENHQRIIIFMAGGATYSELRSCYEITNSGNQKEVYLATSHMLSPNLYLRQLSDLSLKRERLNLPCDRPQKKAPAHLFQDPSPASTPGTAEAGTPGAIVPGSSSSAPMAPSPGSASSRPGAVNSAATAPAGQAPPMAGMSQLSLNSPASAANGKHKDKFGHLLGKSKKEEDGKKKKKHLFRF